MCVANYQPNGTACDDGDACTTNDACSGGNCVGGPPLNCDDNNPCTTDTCAPLLGCQHANNTAISKGDMNGDGLRNGADVQRFVTVWLTEEPTPAELCAADMNCDGARTPDDVPLFVGCLLTGQCSCPP